jgi:hypothetical protein
VPPLQALTFNQLGGVQTRKALTAFAPYEAVSCLGGYFDVNGAFTKRYGGEKYNTTSLAASLSGLYHFRYNADSASEFLIASGTTIKKGNGGSPTDIKTGQTSGTFYNFATHDDRAFIVNKADLMLWYDGTNVRQAGIDAPSSDPTPAANTSGALLNGTYLINVTFESDLGEESNPYSSNATITLSGANDEIDLTSIPVSSDAQVTKRNIYMTEVDGSVLRLQQTINDNSTTTASITTDATGRLLEYTHDVAPSGCGGVISHQSRLIVYKNNKIYISYPTTTDYPGAVYFPQGTLDQETDFSSEVGNSDPITGIISFYDVVFIFKKYDIYILSGTSPVDYRIDRVRNDERIGCVSGRTLAIVQNWCFFVGVNGVYRTNGVEIQDVSYCLADWFNQNSTDTTYKINKLYLENSCAVYFKEKNIYLFFNAAGSATNNSMCYCMDVNSIVGDGATGKIYAKWNPWPGFITQAAAIVIESGVEKWFRGDELGYVFRQEVLNGDGSNVTSTATSGGASTLTDSAQSWTTDLYAGLRINITGGTGNDQERIIASNTGTVITVTVAWDTQPDQTSEYTIGGPPFHHQDAFTDYGEPSLSKRWRYSRPRFETSGDYGVNVSYFFDFSSSESDTFSYDLSAASLFDVSLFDVATFDGSAIVQEKIPIPGSRIHKWASHKIENNNAGQPIVYYGHDKLFQMKGVR